jgi:hypothetical protein
VVSSKNIIFICNLIRICSMVFGLNYVDGKGDMTSPLGICLVSCLSNVWTAWRQADFQLNKIHKPLWLWRSASEVQMTDTHTHRHIYTVCPWNRNIGRYICVLRSWIIFFPLLFTFLSCYNVTIICFLLFYVPVSVSIASIETAERYGCRAIWRNNNKYRQA